MNKSMIPVITQLIAVLIFIGLAIQQFYTGNITNGILWLIMTEVYNIRVMLKRE